MVEESITTFWGWRATQDWRVGGFLVNGFNQYIRERANGSFYAAVWNGSTTLTTTAGAGALQSISSWAAQNASYANYPIKASPGKQLYLVDSVPGNVLVQINGKFAGYTAFTTQLEKKTHEFFFTSEITEPHTMNVGYFIEDKPMIVIPTLKLIPPGPPPQAKLQVRSTPSGAKIFFGLEYTGYTTTHTFTLPPGTYTLNIMLAGYETATRTITLIAGDDKQTAFTLQKIEAPPPPPPTPEEEFKTPLTRLIEALGFEPPQILQAWDTLIGWLTNIFGTDFPTWVIDATTGEFTKLPTTKKILFFVSMQAPISAGEEILRKPLLEMTAREIRSLAEGDPQTLKNMMAQLSNTQRITLFNNLRINPVGRDAADAVFRVAGPSIPKLDAIWKNLPLWQKTLVGIVASAVAIREFVAWPVIDNLTFMLSNPVDKLIADKDWQGALEALERWQNIHTHFQAPYVNTTIANLISGGAYSILMATQQDKINVARTQIEKGMEREAIGTTLSVTTNADPALATIEGVFAQKITPFTTNIAPGSYDLTLEKEGYQRKTVRVIAKENQDNPVTAALQEIPEEITPEAGRLELSVYDKKTGAPIKATLFIDDTPEPYHLHTYALDMKEGAYKIKLEEPGYEIYTDTISITKGQATRITVRLNKIVLPPPEVPPEAPPEPPPPEVPLETGKIQVLSTPSGAEVWIAGEKIGETPTIFDWPPSVTDVTLKKSGYVDETVRAYVQAKKTSTISVALRETRLPPESTMLAMVSINSQPTSAKILLNGVFTDKYTPDYLLLEEGEYYLELTKSGYKPWGTPLKLVRE